MNSIGSPLPDLQVYLLDEQMQLVPTGVVGEIYVGGAGLARGYLHRAGLMAERYVPHPFAKEGGKRLYRSGDLARYRPDGELEYIGRIDHQVKVRGFRIELGEIEAALNQHGTVQESVVLLREDMFSGKQLVAYVVPHHGQTPTIDELRGALKEKLPDYMIPASFVMLDSLPLTSNGKVNSKALPEPDTTRPTLENSYVAPRTPVEEALASIWAEVLRLERIGIHDNFFDLGGDSIRAIQVHAKARQAGIGFSTTQLFRFQTISELAQEATSTSEKYLPAIEKQAFSLISEDDRVRLPAGLEDAYPLTMLQLGMIYHSHYSLDTPAYHYASSFHLQSPFDLQKLKAALGQLASRHAVLRTSFDLTAFSLPLQLVHTTVEIPLEVEDVRRLSSAEQDQRINTWFDAERSRQFDLTRPPLIRFQVHLRSERTFQLSWAEHHAILDGWSVASMLTELFQIYFSLMNEAAPVSDAPAVQFRDYVALEKEALEAEECRGFWKEKLSGATATLVSRWPSRQAHGIGGQTAVNVPIPAEVSDGLKRLATSLSVPLKYLLLAAHLRVLSFISGQSDVSTGVVYNGRPEDGDGERVLGLFLNTLPFRLKINGGTWADLARQTFEIEQEILPFRRYPLAELQRANGNVALFETNFNFIHFHVFENLKSLSALKVLSGKEFGDTNYPFTVEFSVDLATSNVGLIIAYLSSEFCDEQIRRISGYYTAALTAMAHHPFSLYDAHSLLSSQEREQLLLEWNSTSPLPLPSPFIHRLFEEQAALTPDAVAILCDGSSLSYSLLNSKANQLAHHLLSLGLSPEQPVALCLHRSPRMVIALL
ncbi:MAG: condensation domain-containing protein, partial [Acidobacteria bacterium]|nr:condensation domain-containing protein [Acidobacteriota bacterium]